MNFKMKKAWGNLWPLGMMAWYPEKHFWKKLEFVCVLKIEPHLYFFQQHNIGQLFISQSTFQRSVA